MYIHLIGLTWSDHILVEGIVAYSTHVGAYTASNNTLVQQSGYTSLNLIS